ncbi:MAG TPA: class 1 fructose-bisphosphatase [Gemmatimonadales bacterium]|nr:class 1 fructose-bisphosphatase [Gemmatimonadales bacterium]
MHSSSSVVTIERFIIEQERQFPEATGELSNLLYDVCLAAKIISRNVRRAGLADILGEMGTTNVQGELQQKLDVFANETIRNSLQHTGRTCVLASEEDEEPVPVPEGLPVGKYVLLYDPLDGSSNIDVNVPIGTIFSIHRRVTPEGGPGTLQDCLQPGRTQISAGYILYGSSTMLVYSTGKGVHGFTLEPSIGEFLLSHPSIRTPEVGRYYSVNESNWDRWPEGVHRAVAAFKNGEHGLQPRNARYVGSLVADFHRNLLSGGIFLYPADKKSPSGKLRLLYEAAPLAMLAEQAGGLATDGRNPILDIAPQSLHQRVPLIIGSKQDVALATRLIQEA